MDTVSPTIPVERLSGQFRRFGEVGPVYEVVGLGSPRGDGTWNMRIILVESGEEVEYPLMELLEDPVVN